MTRKVRCDSCGKKYYKAEFNCIIAGATLETFSMFETSRQAKFLIPMALSLGYGILFATVISLLLVPSLFLVAEDIRHLLAAIWRMLCRTLAGMGVMRPLPEAAPAIDEADLY